MSARATLTVWRMRRRVAARVAARWGGQAERADVT